MKRTCLFFVCVNVSTRKERHNRQIFSTVLFFVSIDRHYPKGSRYQIDSNNSCLNPMCNFKRRPLVTEVPCFLSRVVRGRRPGLSNSPHQYHTNSLPTLCSQKKAKSHSTRELINARIACEEAKTRPFAKRRNPMRMRHTSTQDVKSHVQMKILTLNVAELNPFRTAVHHKLLDLIRRMRDQSIDIALLYLKGKKKKGRKGRASSGD